jgi:hypothetical protein
MSRVLPPEAPLNSVRLDLRYPAPSPREQNGLARSCSHAAKPKGDKVVRKTTLIFSVVWALVALNSNAQSGPSQFVPFKAFIANTTAANQQAR